ncbi:hypothetical protein EW146_g1540 [Bondarzewia mesenterica]|uniref:RRM domain-containing protein n=1 Tax=Bondarzewia mesenterica TaxID=1095465 RepID=A0A4S4M5E3_9AGAM|nr:hypothetical protein EW146_g1540 [Bondarzewia mesenterica]
MMDDTQTAFATQYPSYGFDLDMMKRSMDTVGGPDAKKARWSPTSFATNGANGLASGAVSASREAFQNYGYGPQANISQGFNGSPPSATFSGNPLYSTSLNTPTNGNGMSQQMSPNSAAAFAQQQQQQQQQVNGGGAYGGFNGYNMLGMGLPAMLGVSGFPYSNQVGGFAQLADMTTQGFNQRVPSLALSTQAANYPGNALTAALGATAAVTGRTVYVGNLPATASVDELLNLVHFGPLESIRVLPEKSCVFLSFLDGATAAAFHADATIKKLALHGQELKIGWGKPSPVPSQVALAISQSNASRNVYLGGLDENVTEEQLRDDLSRFGLIDQVKIVRDKNIGFVHFLSISVATKVVNTLPTEPAWAGKRVNYGKDRCAYIPKSQQAAAQAAQAAAAQSLVAQSAAASLSPINTNQGPFSPFSPYTPFSPDSLQFVTFIDPAAAFTFFQVASYQGLTLNNRRLKIGWGKNSGPLPPALALAVHSGATRNVYIGNIEDFDAFNEERLKRDFGEYGDIELVNFLKEKNCAFVNFTNISNAIKAIDGVKNKADYANLRIAHGKDRCANPPRSGPQGGSSARRSASGNGPTSAGPVASDEGDIKVEGDEEMGNEEGFVPVDVVGELVGEDLKVEA